MTQDEIIEMARETGYPLAEYEGKPYVPPMLAILLKTATVAEREACAQVCEDNADDLSEGDWDSACTNCSDLIRARGQA